MHEDVLIFRAPRFPGEFAPAPGPMARNSGRGAVTEPRRTRRAGNWGRLPGCGDPRGPSGRRRTGACGRQSTATRLAGGGRGAGWRDTACGGRRPLPPAPASRAVPRSAGRRSAGGQAGGDVRAGYPRPWPTPASSRWTRWRAPRSAPCSSSSVSTPMANAAWRGPARASPSGSAGPTPRPGPAARPCTAHALARTAGGSRGPGSAARWTSTSPPWACRPPRAGPGGEPAPGMPVDRGDQQPFPGAAGRCPARYSTSTSPSRSRHRRTRRRSRDAPAAAGSPGSLPVAGLAGPRPGLAGAVVTVKSPPEVTDGAGGARRAVHANRRRRPHRALHARSARHVKPSRDRRPAPRVPCPARRRRPGRTSAWRGHGPGPARRAVTWAPLGRTRAHGAARGPHAPAAEPPARRAGYRAFRHADLTTGPGASVHAPHRTDSRRHGHTPPAPRAGAGTGRRPGVTGEPDELLTIDEVITELRVSRSAFYRWRRRGPARPGR